MTGESPVGPGLGMTSRNMRIRPKWGPRRKMPSSSENRAFAESQPLPSWHVLNSRRTWSGVLKRGVAFTYVKSTQRVPTALQHGDNGAYHEIGVPFPRLGALLNVNTTFSPCVLRLHGFLITVQCGYKIKARGKRTCYAVMPRKGRKKSQFSVRQAHCGRAGGFALANQNSGSVFKRPTL